MTNAMRWLQGLIRDRQVLDIALQDCSDLAMYILVLDAGALGVENEHQRTSTHLHRERPRKFKVLMRTRCSYADRC